ncbi:extracellular solute-binding protein [Cohnella rhizosphaerae]|uniref:Extracellular solute-binding protein n=1 Tax=Cohnella rhizosphaerae TaxID=1457232 RepID=A0A9X4L1C4_9BACL|nr:extracellular solute-binding protein [Cohnella rhizosphaerae]MDG0814713.1 extracellular solute-binding protein [Cohnella rhizosphaerae]
MSLVSACAGNGNNAASPSASAPASAASPSAASPSASAQSEAAKPDPNAKYDPPIEVSTVRYTDSSFKFKDGESLDNNAWTRAYEEELGIKVKNKWIVNGDQFNQKMNLSITSGDLPDLFMVDAKQLRELAEGGMLEDLTQVVADYGTDLTKEMINRGDQCQGCGHL